MKIIAGRYPEEPNWQKYLSFRLTAGSKLSLVFLKRLAALARDFGQPMTSLVGNRSSEQQKVLYENDLAKNGGKPSGMVAAPGISWHENYCAVDLNGSFWQKQSELLWVPKTRLRQSLNEYGLMVPLNRVDSPSVVEWWHLQPIETNGIAGSNRKSFLDADDEIYGVKEVQKQVTIKEFQTANGLTADGVIGPKTIAKALEVLPVVQEILTKDPKAVIQAYVGFSYPEGVWEVIDKHPHKDAVYQQIATALLK